MFSLLWVTNLEQTSDRDIGNVEIKGFRRQVPRIALVSERANAEGAGGCDGMVPHTGRATVSTLERTAHLLADTLMVPCIVSTNLGTFQTKGGRLLPT